tara:strand:+ start:417 stop:851 length:435 start_codon:yes stop_codon:yes gene_type:complete
MNIKKTFKNYILGLRLKKKFVKHNQSFFLKNYNNKDIVLVELNKLCDIHILYSYLSNVLAVKFKAKIIGYNSKYFPSLKNFLIFVIKRFLNLSYFSVYKSFNTSDFFYPKKKKLINQKFLKYFKILKIKKTLCKLKYLQLKLEI